VAPQKERSEIGVLLEDQNFDSHPSQQITQHQTGEPATSNAARLLLKMKNKLPILLAA
jgi:hypothetical protein